MFFTAETPRQHYSGSWQVMRARRLALVIESAEFAYIKHILELCRIFPAMRRVTAGFFCCFTFSLECSSGLPALRRPNIRLSRILGAVSSSLEHGPSFRLLRAVQ